MSIKDEIERTKSQIANHRAQIVKLEAHGKALAMKMLGLEVGDRIVVNRHRKDSIAEVRGVKFWWSIFPTPDAVVVKKDGTTGEQSVGYITDWRKVEASE